MISSWLLMGRIRNKRPIIASTNLCLSIEKEKLTNKRNKNSLFSPTAIERKPSGKIVRWPLYKNIGNARDLTTDLLIVCEGFASSSCANKSVEHGPLYRLIYQSNST